MGARNTAPDDPGSAAAQREGPTVPADQLRVLFGVDYLLRTLVGALASRSAEALSLADLDQLEELARSIERSSSDVARLCQESAHPVGAAALLTKREQQILVRLPRHESTVSIARAMKISPNTAKSHIRSIYAKLGAHSRSEAVTISRRLGMV
jgi:DNA-binding CsgD family transcriptional regulator